MEPSKSIFASKTFWANIAVVVVNYLTQNTDALKPYGVDPQILIPVLGLANVVLRKMTTQPVTVLPK